MFRLFESNVLYSMQICPKVSEDLQPNSKVHPYARKAFIYGLIGIANIVIYIGYQSVTVNDSYFLQITAVFGVIELVSGVLALVHGIRYFLLKKKDKLGRFIGKSEIYSGVAILAGLVSTAWGLFICFLILFGLILVFS